MWYEYVRYRTQEQVNEDYGEGAVGEEAKEGKKAADNNCRLP